MTAISKFDRELSLPARPYSFPHELVDDPSLSVEEKRNLLSEWASDACAVESFPTLRWLPGTRTPVTLSAIMDARHLLDRRTHARAWLAQNDNRRAASVGA